MNVREFLSAMRAMKPAEEVAFVLVTLDLRSAMITRVNLYNGPSSDEVYVVFVRKASGAYIVIECVPEPTGLKTQLRKLFYHAEPAAEYLTRVFQDFVE